MTSEFIEINRYMNSRTKKINKWVHAIVEFIQNAKYCKKIIHLPCQMNWREQIHWLRFFFISSMTEPWISLSLLETLGCSKISRGRRHSADLTSLGRTCLINDSGFLPYFVLNSNFPTWSLFPYLSDKSFQVSSDGYWTLVSAGRYRVIKKTCTTN